VFGGDCSASALPEAASGASALSQTASGEVAQASGPMPLSQSDVQAGLDSEISPNIFICKGYDDVAKGP
jgi:hypothetical protein